MRELTNDEIEKITNFCENWGVICYDVKTELVDHIASMIEQQMNNQPSISFDQAFINARQSFGIGGFDQLIKEREKQISKQGRKAQLRFLGSFFRWPKITLTFLYLTIALTLSYFYPALAKSISLIMLAPSMLLAFMYPSVFYGKTDNFIRSTIPLVSEKYVQIHPLLIFNRKNNPAFLAQIGMILFNVSYLLFSNIESLHQDKIMALFYFGLTGLNLISYLAFKEQRANLLQKAIKNYPEAFQLKAN